MGWLLDILCDSHASPRCGVVDSHVVFDLERPSVPAPAFALGRLAGCWIWRIFLSQSAIYPGDQRCNSPVGGRMACPSCPTLGDLLVCGANNTHGKCNIYRRLKLGGHDAFHHAPCLGLEKDTS